MSSPVENKSHNSTEGKTMVNYQSQALHSKLAIFLKLVVFRTISQIKAPIQVEVIENLSGEAPVPAALRRGPITKSVVGNLLFTFELPECITKKIDMDKLPPLGENVNPERLFLFSERLEGWNIERRQRENGRCDVYYRHRKSKRMFRSISEVVNFLLYETCPENRKRKSPPSKKLEEDHEEEMIWENDLEDISAHYKKLENEAAEVLISMCDGTAHKAELGGASSSDELDLINHIPICQRMEELQEFLINNRKNVQV